MSPREADLKNPYIDNQGGLENPEYREYAEHYKLEMAFEEARQKFFQNPEVFDDYSEKAHDAKNIAAEAMIQSDFLLIASKRIFSENKVIPELIESFLKKLEEFSVLSRRLFFKNFAQHKKLPEDALERQKFAQFIEDINNPEGLYNDWKNFILEVAAEWEKSKFFIDSLLNNEKTKKKFEAVSENVISLRERAELGRVICRPEEIYDIFRTVHGWRMFLSPRDTTADEDLEKQVVVNGNPEPTQFRQKASIDLAHLKMALFNLVQNSFKFGAKNVKIDIAANNDKLTIKVADDGPGMSESQVRTFGLFQDIATTDKGRGSGTGLHEVRNWMKEMNAGIFLEADQSPEKHHTTFTIEFPLQMEAEKPQVMAKAAGAA